MTEAEIKQANLDNLAAQGFYLIETIETKKESFNAEMAQLNQQLNDVYSQIKLMREEQAQNII